ncbi:MAG: CoA transferase [Sphingomonadaceae bacterium]|nr:CoA transferase [Sphingomonadaceae bacterium]
MAAVLEGIRVLDLSWGISGPMAGMMLADSGADVIKIEPTGGDPCRTAPRTRLGYKTWQRGKRSAILDLKNPEDLGLFKMLATHADVLLESFAPGRTRELGIDFETLSALNPRLIYASITAYGRENEHSDRPGYDLLVAARSGLNWEHRGWPETGNIHMSGGDDPLPGYECPWDWLQGPPRDGPMTTAMPAPSMGAFYNAISAINAALVARESTGRGQWVETSLFQGAGAASLMAWQRTENPDADSYNTWINCSRTPKGHFECKDGRWIHCWVPNPRFIIEASEGDVIDHDPDLSVKNDPNRFGSGVEEAFVIGHYQPILAERMKKFDCDDWLAAAAAADVPMQEARSPETALADPILLADGCVREMVDSELGAIRQVGRVLEMEKNPFTPGGPAPEAGLHTNEVKAEAAALKAKPAPVVPAGTKLKSPLDGVRVLDLGLAIAGPFGCQVLADLGGDVIKINAFHDTYWHKNHIAYTSNRGKRSVCLNLKDPQGMEVLRDLVRSADVVQHNMRYDAAVRLGIDYESLKQIKPDLIYCHTRGHESGPREKLPGNDQTGACLAGVQYEDGGMADGGKPFWSLTSLGDIGNGFLSAVGVLQALYHRARTGEGQFVGSAIVYAQLLNCSHVIARPDGSGFDRPKLDRDQTGMAALDSLYKTAEGWIAVVAPTAAHWDALKTVLGAPGLDDPAFATGASRIANDKRLRSVLAKAFLSRSASEWFTALDGAGVPVEISDPTFGQRLHDMEEFRRRKWTVGYHQELVGHFEQMGLLFDFSDTPGVIERPPLVVGECTSEVLREIGYSDERIAELADAMVAGVWEPGQPLLIGPRRFLGYKESASAENAQAPQPPKSA